MIIGPDHAEQYSLYTLCTHVQQFSTVQLPGASLVNNKLPCVDHSPLDEGALEKLVLKPIWKSEKQSWPEQSHT